MEGLCIPLIPKPTASRCEKRTKKDEFLRTNAESPIPDKTRSRGLVIFHPIPAIAWLPVSNRLPIKPRNWWFAMSDGNEEVYEKFAHAVFSINGDAYRLLIVKLGDTYSILFRDNTSGKDTYGGGRYLEIDPAQPDRQPGYSRFQYGL